MAFDLTYEVIALIDVWVYSILQAGSVVILAFYFADMIFMIIRSARRIHNLCLTGTIQAPVSFFDTTPLGRLIARFATDVTIIDTQTLQFLNPALQMLFNTFVIIASIAIGMLPIPSAISLL